MTPKSIRSFAGGLILAAGVCGAVYFFEQSEEPKSQAASVTTDDDMKDALLDNGYIVHSEEEWQAHLAEQTAALEELEGLLKDEEEKDEEAEEDSEKAEEVVIYRTMLTVSSGMTSIDVGEALERANIIKNAIDFFDAVEERDLANKLKPGTYEVESKMSLEEVISAVFE